jgi:hypothetical protein
MGVGGGPERNGEEQNTSQLDIEHRPLTGCAVAAYFVELLAVKVMATVIRSNVI